jgi:hypothetical protein
MDETQTLLYSLVYVNFVVKVYALSLVACALVALFFHTVAFISSYIYICTQTYFGMVGWVGVWVKGPLSAHVILQCQVPVAKAVWAFPGDRPRLPPSMSQRRLELDGHYTEAPTPDPNICICISIQKSVFVPLMGWGCLGHFDTQKHGTGVRFPTKVDSETALRPLVSRKR